MSDDLTARLRREQRLTDERLGEGPFMLYSEAADEIAVRRLAQGVLPL